jgi:hypothetical protein
MADETEAAAIDHGSGRPSVARMYDFYLGGKDNYPVDQAAAQKMMAAVPESVRMVRVNRAFLVAAVHYLAAEAGIRQFLDIGSGLPTQQNVHEVAQAVSPDTRVVYVDHDPLAVAHGQALLATNEHVRYINGDLLHPETILGHPDVRELIDFDQPVAVLIVAILHFVSDADDPVGIVGRLRDAMPEGSYLAISHVLDDPRPRAIGEILVAAGAPPWSPRTPEKVLRFFDGFELIDPGLATLSEWHPPAPAPGSAQLPGATRELRWQLAGVGRKR